MITAADLTEPDISIAIVDDGWNALDLDIKAICTRAVTAGSKLLTEAPKGELSIAFMDDAEIKALNASYRGKDKPTNVLSFPADGINPALGDIALARETCEREARDKSIALTDHLTHLCLHGYLHLCGYDHETDHDAAQMEALEIKALAGLGIANPYEEPHV